ncbi:unnamed protein product [Meloidogyne enterolobii]|uniref:Uncharacterized protein n=1 Tax=Meloidogyne enterolobii TaxID=390850 RepID=A0ACB0Y977_MELEN
MHDCLIVRLLFLQLLNSILIFLTTPINAAELVEFLFRNQILCLYLLKFLKYVFPGGQPFSDAQWVPVLDQCELDCKPEREICMEDDQMKQSCRKRNYFAQKIFFRKNSFLLPFKVPEDCVKAFQDELKLTTNIAGLFNLLTEATTLPTTKNSQKHRTTPTRQKIKSLKAPRRKAKKERINTEKLLPEKNRRENLNNTEAIITPLSDENQKKNKIRISVPKIIKTTKRRVLLTKRSGEMRRKENLKIGGRQRRKLKNEDNEIISKRRHEGNMKLNRKRAKRVENRIKR